MVAVEMVVLLDFWGEKVQIRGRWKGRGNCPQEASLYESDNN